MWSALASLGAAGLSAYSQSVANRDNVRYRNEANRLSIDLANTSHRREIADLKAAGLNPILSAGGQGASTPQIGAAEVGSVLGSGASSSLNQAASRLSTAYKLDNEMKEQEIEAVDLENTIRSFDISAARRDLVSQDLQNALLREQLSAAQIANAKDVFEYRANFDFDNDRHESGFKKSINLSRDDGHTVHIHDGDHTFDSYYFGSNMVDNPWLQYFKPGDIWKERQASGRLNNFISPVGNAFNTINSAGGLRRSFSKPQPYVPYHRR